MNYRTDSRHHEGRTGEFRSRRTALALTGLVGGVVAASAALLPPVAGAAISGTVLASAPATATQANPLPAMSVTDVRSSKAVKLQTAFTGRRPLLVWFWAPT